MPYTIEYDEEQNCVFARFTGIIDMALTLEYIAEVTQILKVKNCRRLLNDSTEAQLKLNGRDILSFPKLAQISEETKLAKRAVLARPNTSGYLLYETLSHMAGQKVKIFYDREEALQWLMSDATN